MGILGALFGGSKQSSQQTQTSDSLGYSVNRGTSSSTSGATSTGRSAGVSGSSSSVFAGDLFQQLYGNALGAASAINPAVATQRVLSLFTGGAGIIEQLAGGGAGQDYLE